MIPCARAEDGAQAGAAVKAAVLNIPAVAARAASRGGTRPAAAMRLPEFSGPAVPIGDISAGAWARMKHRSIRELYDYWNARRGRRPAPARSDIDPGDIRTALADTFIVRLDETAGHPFRIAGTRVCALFGRDLKHEPFLHLWSPQSRVLVRDLFDIVAQESIGLLAGVTGVGDVGGEVDLELLALPLIHDGRSDGRVLGALAPCGVPLWIGTDTLGDLTLGTFRYVGPAVTRNDDVPKGSLVPTRARRRHGLVVYDGGLTRDEAGSPPTG